MCEALRQRNVINNSWKWCVKTNVIYLKSGPHSGSLPLSLKQIKKERNCQTRQVK